jgi:hypothetical protein
VAMAKLVLTLQLEKEVSITKMETPEKVAKHLE